MDHYFVRFNGQGVARVPRNLGAERTLLPSTMPHTLISEGQTARSPSSPRERWDTRGIGRRRDRFPRRGAFIGKGGGTISDVTFHKNRWLPVRRGRSSPPGQGDFFNFWRTTAPTNPGR